MKILLTLTLLAISVSVFGQDWTEGWDESTLKEANTCDGDPDMTKEEQMVIFYCNLARINPQLFSETILTKYIEENNIPKSQYTTSLFKTFKKLTPRKALQPHKDLSKVAKQHATESGKRGSMGHANYDRRYFPIGKMFGVHAENCDYGSDKAIDIAMSLLIDEGIPSYGHRVAILNAENSHCSASIQPHKKHDHVCVMSFAGLKKK